MTPYGRQSAILNDRQTREPLSQAEIKAGRFVLRPFRRRDTASLHQAVLASRDELAEFLPWANPLYTRASAAGFVRESIRSWREAKAYDFAVRRPERPDYHVGNVSIWHVSRGYNSGEIGYWIRTGETGRGAATEAAGAMLRVGFERLGMNRIVVRIAAGNSASEQVARKLGFTWEGVLREEVKIGGRWVDHSIWSFLKREYGGGGHPSRPVS